MADSSVSADSTDKLSSRFKAYKPKIEVKIDPEYDLPYDPDTAHDAALSASYASSELGKGSFMFHDLLMSELDEQLAIPYERYVPVWNPSLAKDETKTDDQSENTSTALYTIDTLPKLDDTSNLASIHTTTEANLVGDLTTHIGIRLASDKRPTPGAHERSSSNSHIEDGSEVTDTFLTGMDVSEETTTTQVPLAAIKSLDVALENLPDFTEPQPLPPSCDLDAVMERASERISFKSRKDIQMWDTYFQSDENKAILQDSYWFIVIHFFNPQAKQQFIELPEAVKGHGALDNTGGSLDSQGKLKNDSAEYDKLSLEYQLKPIDNHDVLTQAKLTIMTRMATSFVTFFAGVNNVHKDDFFDRYYDGMAQTLYYSLSQVYTESEATVHHPQVKEQLVKLTCMWTLGHVPVSISTAHWDVLEQRAKQDTLMERIQRTTESFNRHHALKKKLTSLQRDFLKSPNHRQTRQYSQKTLHSSTVPFSPASPSGEQGGERGGGAGAGGQQLHTTSSRVTLASTPKHASRGSPRTQLNMTSILESEKHDHNDKLKKQQGVDGGNEDSYANRRIPLRVFRKRQTLHHSQLVQHFLTSEKYGKQSSHAVVIRLTKPSVHHSPTDLFLDYMRGVTERSGQKYSELKSSYLKESTAASRSATSEQKLHLERCEKLKLEQEQAQNDSLAFAKNLMTQYQDARYSEIREPSKSLSLRRLGHYRNYQSEEIAGSVINRDSRNAVLRSSLNKFKDENDRDSKY